MPYLSPQARPKKLKYLDNVKDFEIMPTRPAPNSVVHCDVTTDDRGRIIRSEGGAATQRVFTKEELKGGFRAVLDKRLEELPERIRHFVTVRIDDLPGGIIDIEVDCPRQLRTVLPAADVELIDRFFKNFRADLEAWYKQKISPKP
jgi:energy-converting hydrogenase Eha subunit F